MERRMLLAVILSILCVTAYSAITGRGCMAPPPQEDETATDDEQPGKGGPPSKTAPGNVPPGNVPPGKAAPRKGDDQPGIPGDDEVPAGDGEDLTKHPQATDAPAQHVTLSSTELDVVLTTQGGAVHDVRHRKAFESDRTTPFEQVVPLDPTLLFGCTDDTDVTPATAPGGADRRELPAGPMRNPKLKWTLDAAAAQASPENDVVFTFETPGGLVHTKRWILAEGEGRFDLTLRLAVRATSAASVPASGTVDVTVLASSGHLREYVRGAFANPNIVLYRLSSQSDLEDASEQSSGLAIQELSVEGRNREHLAVFGMRSAYFLSLYFRTPGENEPDITHFWATGEDASQRGSYDENLAAFWKDDRGVELTPDSEINKRVAGGVPQLLHCWMTVRLPVADAGGKVSDLRFYVGPNERNILRQDGYGPLKSVVTYPNSFDFVADILLWIYDIWRNLFGSAGVAIILMTVCVRGAMMPLSVRNQLSMRRYGRKVAKLKPKVAELQKKFSANPKKLRDEQMKLYREHGVGFPSGCVMMLVQIPIFFALFSSLRVEYTIRGAEFLWINDLAGPDRLIDFGERIIDLGFFWVESINVLPILMVGLSILHMRNMPKPADEQQAQQMKMMKWLPIFFAFILYNYTAALAIYMVLSSAVAIVESKIVRSKDGDAKDAEAAPAKA